MVGRFQYGAPGLDRVERHARIPAQLAEVHELSAWRGQGPQKGLVLGEAGPPSHDGKGEGGAVWPTPGKGLGDGFREQEVLRSGKEVLARAVLCRVDPLLHAREKPGCLLDLVEEDRRRVHGGKHARAFQIQICRGFIAAIFLDIVHTNVCIVAKALFPVLFKIGAHISSY